MNFIFTVFLILGVYGSTNFKIQEEKFILIMKSGEIINRYTFYDDFWVTLGKYFEIPMNRSLVINSNFY